MSEEKNQTSVDETTEEVEESQETEVEETTEKTADETVENESTEEPSAQEIDYKKKFSESTTENQRILNENKELMERLEALEKAKGEENDAGANYGNDSEPLYPGFEQLSEEEQKNLLAYTEGIKRKALEEINKDPSISFAKESYNERKWDTAFDKVKEKFPDLKESESEFRSKYLKKNNVPDNIEEILTDLAKVHLFDKARDLGAKEAKEKSENRIDVQRQQSGSKTAPKATSRSLEDWQKLASSDPVKFARLSEEFNKDMKSGKL